MHYSHNTDNITAIGHVNRQWKASIMPAEMSVHLLCCMFYVYVFAHAYILVCVCEYRKQKSNKM